MKKQHVILRYIFPEDGTIQFLTYCGIDSRNQEKAITGSIITERANCRECKKHLQNELFSMYPIEKKFQMIG